MQIHVPLGLLVLPGRDSCQCLSSLRLRVDELPIGALPIPKRLPLSVKPHRSSLANNDRLTVTQQHLFYDAISTDKEQNRQRLRRLCASSFAGAASCGLLQSKTCANRFAAHGEETSSGKIHTPSDSYETKTPLYRSGRKKTP